MGEEWAREWGPWCAATRAPETPAQQYAAIPLKGWGPDTRPRPTVIRRAGPDHPWTRRRGNGCRRPPGRKRDGLGMCPHSSGHPSRPASSFTPPTYSGLRRYAHGDTRGHRPVARPRGRGPPARHCAVQSWGADIQRRPVPAGRHPGALAPHAHHRHCSRAAPGAGQLRRAASGMGGSRGRHPAGPPPPRHRERVPMGCADAPPHGAPRVHGNPPKKGHPRPAWDNLIAAFHDHGILLADTWREVQRKTLGRDYPRRVRARLPEIRDPL